MKPYPSYKDSGVEWIGKIPSHWDCKQLKHISKIENSGVWGKDEPFEESLPLPIPTTGQLTIEGEWIYDGMDIRYLTKSEFSNYRCIEGDIVVVKSSGSSTNIITGKCGYINSDDSGKFGFSNFLLRVRPMNLDSKLTYYFLQSKITKQRIERMVSSTTYPNLKVDEYVKSILFIPPIQEQSQIVSFLDRKTQKIDELIEKTEKKIELLKEKRTSLINHCVTKGLNPNVEMKDSGVEWIGDIQEHWKVTRLKFLSFIKYGLGQPPKELEDGLPIIRATNISKGNIIPHDLLYADPNDIPYDRNPILQENDIIVVRSGAYTGDSAIIPKEYEGAIAGYDMVVRVHKADSQYIAYSLLSHSVLHNQIDLCRMRAAQPHLNAEELGNTLIFQPPNPEQKQIVKYLDKQTQKIDSTIEKETQRTELLKEYRQSLISEVVTGKVDVRDWKE